MTKRDPLPLTRPHRQEGVSLVEVLITVVILAVGLLGIAGLQLMSKRSNFEADQRTTASQLAQNLVERMRANPNGLAAYVDNGAELTGSTLNAGSLTCNDTTVCVCAPAGTVSCTDAGDVNEIAGYVGVRDLWEFEQLLAGVSIKTDDLATNTAGLVQPTACLAGPAGGVAGNYIVTIAWRGQTKLSDPDAANLCGRTSAKYDSEDTAGDNAHRRLLVVDTFIAN